MSEWRADGLKERVAYVRGLAKGMNVNMVSKEGRLITSILDVLADVADTMDEVTSRQEDLEEYVTCMDEDLADLEGVDDDDDDDDEWVEVTDSDVAAFRAGDAEEEDDEIEEQVVLEVECPYCHDDFRLDPDAFDGHQTIHVTCPSCREVLRVDDEVDVIIETMDNGTEYDDIDMDAGYPYEEP